MTKRTVVLLAILGATAVVALATFVPRLRSSIEVPVSARLPDVEREFATEQDWLAATILRTTVSLARYAREPGQPIGEPAVRVRSSGAGAVTFALLAGGETVQESLSLSPFIWSPVPYTPLARRLVGGTRDGGTTPASWGIEMLRRLGDPRTEIVQAENRRVSDALTATPAEAALHEQAALVLAVLALKEHAGRFHDVRVALCRLTGHLALAAALRADGASRSAEGLVAEAILLAVTGRHEEALATLRALSARVPADVLTPWAHVITLRASGDWRILEKPDAATLLERLDHYVALRERLGRTGVIRVLQEGDFEPVADWTRVIAEQPISVGTGNRFADTMIDAELGEARTLFASFGGGQLDEPALVSRLNDPPAGPIVSSNGVTGVQVVDWGLWAAFLQRHFLVAGNAVMYHYARELGLPQEGAAIAARVEPLLERLTLFPLLARARAADEANYDASMPGGVLLCAKRAELVTPANWRLMLERPAFAGKPWAVPNDQDWFSPSLPFGCVMDVTPRMTGPFCWRSLSVEQLAQLRKVAPYDNELAWHYLIEKFTKNASADTIRSVYGRLMEYDATAMNAFVTLREDDPADYVPMYRRICELLPQTCSTLAQYLVNRGREEEAAAVYEDWVQRAPDRVGVSHAVLWLVRYYFDTGRSDRALELAREAGDVYSEPGLFTLGEALERSRRPGEAEACYRAIAERYDNSDELLAFLLRVRTKPGGERYRQEASALLSEVFGGELERANATVLREPPARGAKITWRSKMAEAEGLQLDDVIVALDGVRVGNSRQYEILKSLNATEHRTYTVWRNGHYLDVEARAPHRWLQIGYQDFRR